MTDSDFSAFEAQLAEALKQAPAENSTDRASIDVSDHNSKDMRGSGIFANEESILTENVVTSAPMLNPEYVDALNQLKGKKRTYRQEFDDDQYPKANYITENSSINLESNNGTMVGPANAPPGISSSDNRAKKFLRTAAGKIWEDKTFADWPENDFRLWVGQLGPDTKDETLKACFEKYTSFNKARVVLNKRTGECKGFGFVSFSDPMEMVKAMRENQRKYCGSRRMFIKRSESEKRDIKVVRKQTDMMAKLRKKLGI